MVTLARTGRDRVFGGWLGALLVVLFAGWLVAQNWNVPWIPAGPLAEEPGFGDGSDWDRRWQIGLVGEAARARGVLPWWDPYHGLGSPLISEPESFLLHPAWLVGVHFGGVRSGFSALYLFNLCLLFLGLAWLARRLGLPPPAVMASGLLLLVSDEWAMRLESGHVMVLGLCAWPAVVAAALQATEPGGPARPRLRGAVVCGALLGLTAIGGSHYPLPYALFLVVLLVLTRGASDLLKVGLVVVFAVPLLLPQAPPGWRLALEGAGALVLLAAALGQPARRLRTLGLVATGLLATAGVFVLTAARTARFRREIFTWSPPPGLEPLALSELAPGAPNTMERWLPGAGLEELGLLVLGVALLALVSRPLATAGLVMALAGLGTGLPLRPWALTSAVPGMSAAMSQHRLQWVLLILGPIGLVLVADRLARRVGGRWLALGLSLAGGLIAWANTHQMWPEAATGHTEQDNLPEDAGRVRQVAAARTLSNAVYDGVVARPRAGWESSGDLVAPGPGPELAVVHDRAKSEPLAPDMSVEAVLDRWEVRAPPGTAIAIAQRDRPGWRCHGGQIDPDLELAAERPDGIAVLGRGVWWLTVRVGSSGHAVCRWRPPELVQASLAQLLAGCLLMAVLLWPLIPSRRVRGRRR